MFWKRLGARRFQKVVGQLRRNLATSKLAAVQTSEFEVRRSLGQPSPFTHPYLLKSDEVTFGISVTKCEYADRRQLLLERFAAACASFTGVPGCNGHYLILIPAADLKYSAPDVPYTFRQDSNFLYLSGFQEPDSVLAIYNQAPGSLDHSAALVVTERDEQKELWNGPLAGVDGALELTGVDVSMVHSEFKKFLSGLVKKSNSAPFLCADVDWLSDAKKLNLLDEDILSRLRYPGIQPLQFVHKLRWIKSESERNLMRIACNIGTEAVIETMKFCKAGMRENVLVGKMDLESKLRGAQGLAYPPVVAGGPRANIIHYLLANQVLDGDQLVLMDAGCDFHGYVSDITRTWPVGKRFSSDAQRSLYEALSEIHDKLLQYVAEVRPLVLSDVQKKMEILIGKQLQRLGLLSKSLEGKDLLKEVDPCCPHHVSHYLGMDVHDTSSVSRNIEVQPGVCVTVEPGLYIDSENMDFPPEFRGIGMRIEDDVLITETGAEILTSKCPKNTKDLLQLLQS